MKEHDKPRLRFFENSPAQRHILGEDKYIYQEPEPSHRVAVIGTGTIGQEHMRVATLLGRARVHGVFDTVTESVDAALTGFSTYADHTPRRYASLDEACSDPDVDALLICTPNFTHIDLVEAAAGSGKALFLEKPMATTLPDARRIVEIAESYPSFIQVGLQYRYKAPYAEARHEVLERGSLGDVKTLSMSEYRPPFLDKVGQWNKFNEYSGGTLVEKCCHYFDLLNLFANRKPVRVFASGGRTVNFAEFEYKGRSSDIDDHAFVLIDYIDGVRASFTLNMFAPHFHEELVVTGTGGRLVATESFDFYRDKVARSHVRVEAGETAATRHIDLSYTDDIDTSGHHGATFFEHIAFMDRLEGRETDAATPLQGLWSIIVAAAAQESIHSGQAVAIDEFITAHDLDALTGS
jgi:predicted dehydrogenase